MTIGSYLSVTTLNVNELNAPTKRQRLAEWIQKQEPYKCCLQDTNLKTRVHVQTESGGLEKDSMQIETKRKQD